MTDRHKEDCIGIAGYNIDIREVQWLSMRTFFFPNAADELYICLLYTSDAADE